MSEQLSSTRAGGVRAWSAPVTAASLAFLAIVAVFRMEASGADYDPQYMRVIVERTIRYGGTYYENGIHNKGPLEPLLYEIAARVGGDAGFWFVIAVFALAAAACVGVAVALCVVRSGGPPAIAAAMATMAVVHLTLSSADYAGVLYARNMTVALLSMAFSAAAFDPAWSSARRRVAAALTIGIATGLAVQTLLTACFTATPVLLWAMWMRRHERVLRRPAWVVMPVVSAAAFASAPAYYLMTGSWRPFVNGWWVYARFMSTGTGRDFGGQIDLGWDQFFDYYRQRPLLAILIQIWLVVSARRWHSLGSTERSVRLLALVWFVGAWVELVLSQRYSSHYFSVLAVPTMMIFATLAADVATRWQSWLTRRPAFGLLSLTVAIVAVFAGGREPFGVGVEAAATVDSVQQLELRRNAGIDGRTHMIGAALDLVSVDDDPLLMWTSFPWPYLLYDRVSATRYIWKSFLVGEIYLGESGPEYVLPGTWEQFEADVDRTDPTAFVVESVNPIAPDTPFAARVERDFTEVFADEIVSLSFRNDLADWLATPMATGTPFGVGDSVPESSGCVRVDATLALDRIVDEPLRIEFVDPIDDRVAASIVVSASSDDAVSTESNRFGVAGHTAVSRVFSTDPAVSIISGARSAVVVIDGQIAGAVDLDPDVRVVVRSGAGAIGEAMRSRPPAFTGC